MSNFAKRTKRASEEIAYDEFHKGMKENNVLGTNYEGQGIIDNEKMKRLKIAEGNKSICEYLKFKESKTNVYEVPNCWPDGPKTGWIECSIWHIGFERDWNMLMPVVQIISKVPLIGATDLQDTCYPRTFGMLNLETGNLMVRFNGMFLNEAPTLIEATWLAVVEFVNAEIQNVKLKNERLCGVGQNIA